jgi:hypothetical protein
LNSVIEFRRITVECHSGSRLDEYPIAFNHKNRRWEIREIIDRWYEGGIDSSKTVIRYFRVRTAGGRQFLLRHEPHSGLWYGLMMSGDVD